MAFSPCLSQICRKTNDFFRPALLLAISLNVLTRWKSSLVVLWSWVRLCHPNGDTVTVPFPFRSLLFLSLAYCSGPLSILWVMGDNGHLCLILGSPFSVALALGWLYIAFIVVGEWSFFSCFLQGFYHEGKVNFVESPLHLLWLWCDFSFILWPGNCNIFCFLVAFPLLR